MQPSCKGTRLKLLLFLIGSMLFSLACNQKELRTDPDKQPYKLVAVKLYGMNTLFKDLNGDGVDEIITYAFSPPGAPQTSYILIKTSNGKVIEQVNFSGSITRTISFADYNNDGNLEILVPFIRNDSLFVSFVDSRGTKLFLMFLTAGKPRKELEGYLQWDAFANNFFLLDLDGDGKKELVTIVTTGFARLPRGVLVHSLPDGRLIGQSIIGSPPSEVFVDDFDNDGFYEIVCITGAPNNGAVAGGFDDKHSYLIIFRLAPEPIIIKSEMLGEKYTGAKLFYEDWNGDGSKEFMYIKLSYSSRAGESVVEIIEPGTWKVLSRRSFTQSLALPIVVNLDFDTKPELLCIRSQNELVALNTDFRIVRKLKFPFAIGIVNELPDLDDDGLKEFIVSSGSSFFILGPDFKIKAITQQKAYQGFFRFAQGKKPLLIFVKNDQILTSVDFVKNKKYLFNLYGPFSIVLIAGILVFSLAVTGYRQYRHFKLYQHSYALALDKDAKGLILFDSRQQIKMMNTTCRQWLGVKPEKKGGNNVQEVLQKHPSLLEFVQQAEANPSLQGDKIMKLDFGDGEKSIKASIQQISPGRSRKTYWLLTLADRTAESQLRQARTWTKMAQKVAHDIKNPMSAILLTLQRLQMHYHDKYPQAADEFDPFINRIMGRIESVRLMSRNFMNFVDAEKPVFTATNITDFIREVSHNIELGLPPDVQLKIELTNNLPVLHIDQQGMLSVLENLTTNAINAMPTGGIITIKTQMAHGLQIPGSKRPPQDYVVIEVRDTGVGLTESVRQQILDPDLLENGSEIGLGLAIVKKVITDHNGFIEVETEQGTGTVFSLYLPVATTT